MEFTFQIPTKIIVGEDCVKKNASLLSSFGKRAVIVKSGSAGKNGALSDLCAALEQEDVCYHVCENVPPNPSPEDVAKLLGYAPNFDFIAVSYTHLDVYKRQPWHWQFHKATISYFPKCRDFAPSWNKHN